MRAVIVMTLLILFVTAACGSGSTAAPSGQIVTTAPATAALATAQAATKAPAATVATTFQDGRYAGTWTNTTFGSTGSAALDVKIDPTAFTAAVTLTLGGNVFGSPAPAPETFTFPITANGVSFSGKSKTFGDLTVTMKDGKATFKGDNVSARVKTFEGTGTYGSGAITMNYNVTLSDGSKAQGTVSLKKA